jgi:hypothetical protein
MTVNVGDWIVFERDGRLVIGRVQYISRSYSGFDEYVTDCGRVSHKAVLEVRSK